VQSVDLIYSYFPQLTDAQKDQFARLLPLYQEWNARINVISRKDIDNLYLNHVLHSLGIAKMCSFNAGAQILDVGTGGGFPGIPLAILFPEVNFHLVDSIGKKITVVSQSCCYPIEGVLRVGSSQGEERVKAQPLQRNTLPQRRRS
jgi:16S rRNA (guanine527-N7)-methyltransferase